MGVGELCPTAWGSDATTVENSTRKPAYGRHEAGETRRQLLTVAQNFRRGGQRQPSNWERWRWGHDDDNPSVGNSDGGNSGGRVFAQGMLARSPLASCLRVSAR